MNDAKRNKIITFRVTDEEYTKIQDAALAQGTDPNDWCRDAAIGCSHHMLTINDRMIYTEIAAFRHLLTQGFKLLLKGNPTTATVWTELTEDVDQRLAEIFTDLLSRRRPG
jgi:uncharacterized protein (DUF1778 family)